MKTRQLALICTACGPLLGCGSDDPICDAGALAEALAEASGGDRVVIGSCELTGAFVVPAGVTLAGQGPSESIIHSPGGDAIAVTLVPAFGETKLEQLSVVSDGAAAIAARGLGNVAVEGVTISASLGIGIGIEDVTAVRLADVTLTGPVSADNAGDFPADLGPRDAASHGLLALRSAMAATNLQVSGFGAFGALAIDSHTVWQGGSASDNLGTGVMIEGGSASLGGIELCRTLLGQREVPAYGAVFGRTRAEGGGAAVTASDLTVCDNDTIGLLVLQAASLDLQGSAFVNNGGVGLLISNSANSTVRESTFVDTRQLSLPLGPMGAPINPGDGIELLNSNHLGVHFEDLSLSGNERVGLLIDLGREDVDILEGANPWTNVTADASGTAWGARCQAFPLADTEPESWLPEDPVDGFWDDGIEHTGAAATNDSSFDATATGILEVATLGEEVGAVSCCNVPGLSDAANDGLGGLGVPGP